MEENINDNEKQEENKSQIEKENNNNEEKIKKKETENKKEKEKEKILEEGAEIKVILLGESGVGKTSLIKAYLDKDIDKNEITTSVPILTNKKISAKYKSFDICLWDTAGQEKFRSVTSTFYKGTHIAIFVYDVTVKESFKQLEKYWVKSLEDIIGKDTIYGLAGNKIDLFDKEEVSENEGREFAEKIGAIFKETSALNCKKDIIQFINELVEKLLKKENLIQYEERITLTKNDIEKPKKKCCFF